MSHAVVIGALNLTRGVNVLGLVAAGILRRDARDGARAGLSGVMLVLCPTGAALLRRRAATMR